MLTPEINEKLAAPFPKEYEKQRKNPGGKVTSFIDVDILEERLDEVDPSWAKHVEVNETAVTVHYTICGVPRGGSSDLGEESSYGTPVKNAEANASRRALRKFKVGAYLWHEDSVPKSASAYRSGSNAQVDDEEEEEIKYRPSGPQINFLRNLGVPDAIIDRLPAKNASALISILKDAQNKEKGYKNNPNKYIAAALQSEKVDRAKLVKFLDVDED